MLQDVHSSIPNDRDVLYLISGYYQEYAIVMASTQHLSWASSNALPNLMFAA